MHYLGPNQAYSPGLQSIQALHFTCKHKLPRNPGLRKQTSESPNRAQHTTRSVMISMMLMTCKS